MKPLSPMAQVMLSGVEEVAGAEDAQVVLSFVENALARQPAGEPGQTILRELTAIQQVLDEIYGWHGGQGVGLQAGRYLFNVFAKQYNNLLQFDGTDFRLLPMQKRLRTGLERLAQAISQNMTIQAHLVETATQWLWSVDPCPVCWQRPHSDRGICNFWQGFLQEYFSAMTGGKFYPVTERECQAAGTTCSFQIERKAVE